MNATPQQLWDLTKQVDPLELPAFDYALKWFRDGMTSVFLQDADALLMGTYDIVKILEHLRENFPWIDRVTTYSRSSTLNKMSDEELMHIKNAGLTRVHVGLESGSDSVLKLVKKGASKDIHIKAGQRVRRVGLELSEYVMPGLGGRELSHEHAIETADALNQIDPHFIRLRPLALTPRAPLYQVYEHGDFHRINDIDLTRELITLIENLDAITSRIVSDHILNLFTDIEGQMPNDRGRLIEKLQRFLDLDSENQLLYRLGRRLNIFEKIDDMQNTGRLERVRMIVRDQGVNAGNIDQIIDSLMARFI